MTAHRAGVPNSRRHDHTLVAGGVAAVWLAIIAGFGVDLVRRAHNHQLAFPLLVHLHVVAYGGWLVLLVAQVGLARAGRVGLHRRLGALALVLLPMMLVLGPAAAIQDASNPYMPDRWIAWLAVQFTNALGAGVLIAAGLLWRRDAAAHRRLMLMGTVALTEPGFGRLFNPGLADAMGDGYAGWYVSTYVGTLALVLAAGAYDLLTRRRLHPAYVAAAAWIFANEAVADWLFHQPWWLAAMRALTNHPAR